MVLVSPPLFTSVAADACLDKVPGIEQSMQDGLSDLVAATNLREEARHGADTATATDVQTCGFLQNSRDAYRRARAHFADCSVAVDDLLERCRSPDWGAITANPELCDQRVVEIDTQLAAMPADIARYCKD